MQLTETWAPVPIVEFQTFYEASDLGRVRSLPRQKVGKGGSLYTAAGGLRKLVLNHRGYLTVYLYGNGKPRNLTVHRLVAGAFIPNPLDLPEVNHLDQSKLNNRADNLEWIDRVGNHLYSADLRPTRHFRRFLSDTDVTIIKALAANGASQSSIAKGFGIRQSTVSRLISGERRHRAA